MYRRKETVANGTSTIFKRVQNSVESIFQSLSQSVDFPTLGFPNLDLRAKTKLHFKTTRMYYKSI